MVYLSSQHTLQLAQLKLLLSDGGGEGKQLASQDQVTLTPGHLGKDREEGCAAVNCRAGRQGGVAQDGLAEGAQREGGDFRRVPEGRYGGAGVAEALDDGVEGVKEMIFVKGFEQKRAKYFSLRFMADQYHTITGTTAGI